MIKSKKNNNFITQEQISDNEVIRAQHGQDESNPEPVLPDLVVYPRTPQEKCITKTKCNM